jgi:peptidoglycan/LPS O-acetylase OafA/YrhL
MAWSWYLANDMQFFVISPIFLLALSWYPKIGVLLTSMGMVASSVATYVITYKHKLQTKFALDMQNPTDTEGLMQYFNLIYVKPWTRIAPYLVGLLTGYLLFNYNRRPFDLRRGVAAIGWTVAAFLMLIPLYSTYHADMTLVEASLYNALSRTSWALGLAWVIFACTAGCGGIVSNFLSSSFWVPLSRLTYTAYLIHPIFLLFCYRSLQSGLIFAQKYELVFVGSNVFWVYVVSIIVTLLVESPSLTLDKFIFRKSHSN